MNDLPHELSQVEAFMKSLVAATIVAIPYIRENKNDPSVRDFVDRTAQQASEIAESFDEALK
jgi:hypothetical protein